MTATELLSWIVVIVLAVTAFVVATAAGVMSANARRHLDRRHIALREHVTNEINREVGARVAELRIDVARLSDGQAARDTEFREALAALKPPARKPAAPRAKPVAVPKPPTAQPKLAAVKPTRGRKA